MFLEIVKFGNGVAIEVRDTASKVTILYMFVCALQTGDLIQEGEMPVDLVEMDAFGDQCMATIDRVVDEKLRWLMLCTDIDMLTTEFSKEFDEFYLKAFKTECPDVENPKDTPRAEVIEEAGLTMKHRVWMLDRQTRRVFCVHFQFARPIYKTTLLAGVMLKHKTFQAQYRRRELDQEEPVPNLKDEEETDAERMLKRLRELLPKKIDDETETGVLESREVDVTEFIVKDAKIWCGDGSLRCVWLAQQLNVWFNTPVTEECWFRPSSHDPFKFTVGVWDEITTPDTSKDAEKWLALSAPSAQNTMWRYPHGDTMCGTPKGILGVGHFLPEYDHDMKRWTSIHHLTEVRVFRLYKTQYPFVYSLMPDNDQQVRALKSKLKISTESNPGLAEKGKEDMQARLKTSTEGGQVKKFTPLIATVPTLELERYVKAVFDQTPRYRYRVWWCARYDDLEAKALWIPVSPTE
jgi:hypothetical protein